MLNSIENNGQADVKRLAISSLLLLQLPCSASEESVELRWLAHCINKVDSHYRERADLKYDKNYKNMRVIVSFFLAQDGTIGAFEIDRDATAPYLDKYGNLSQTPVFSGLSDQRKCYNNDSVERRTS